MLVVEIDRLDTKSFERSFGHSPDVFRAAVYTAGLSILVELKTEFGRDRHTVDERRQCFAYELLVHKGPVHLRGVEERYAALDGLPYQRDALISLGNRIVTLAE